MKVLWVTNKIFPAPSKELGIPNSVKGGWLEGLASQLKTSDQIRLAIATTYPGTGVKIFDIEGVKYYLIPSKAKFTYDRKLVKHWKSVCTDFQPEVIHVHGTEFALGLALMRSLPEKKYLISI